MAERTEDSSSATVARTAAGSPRSLPSPSRGPTSHPCSSVDGERVLASRAARRGGVAAAGGGCAAEAALAALAASRFCRASSAIPATPLIIICSRCRLRPPAPSASASAPVAVSRRTLGWAPGWASVPMSTVVSGGAMSSSVRRSSKRPHEVCITSPESFRPSAEMMARRPTLTTLPLPTSNHSPGSNLISLLLVIPAAFA